MELQLTESELAFRDELRDWLADHLVGEFKDFNGQGGPCDDYGWDLRLAWDKELSKDGWLGLGWPTEYGGRPATLNEEITFHVELANARAPYIATINSVDLFGPALLMFGTEEQKLRFIPPIIGVEELWGQGFSEPNAGSDLAGLRTKAELDGDKWIINGQKIWTSSAHVAHWLYVICRTTPIDEKAKHRGLSLLLVPVDQPGVEIRTIRNMAGGIELCECFFDNAETRADLVMGPVNEGWKVAQGALGVERGTTLLPYQIRFEQELDDLVKRVKPTGVLENKVNRDAVARAYVELGVLRMNNERLLSALLDKREPGPVASIGKLYASHWHQRIGELKMQLIGIESMLTGPDYELDKFQRSFLVSRSETIYGGSDQIQHNIIGDRVLGLPR
ncbi:MAG: acyl-CoA dehydrogenase family protein [Acidimicrobiia bacterium]